MYIFMCVHYPFKVLWHIFDKYYNWQTDCITILQCPQLLHSGGKKCQDERLTQGKSEKCFPVLSWGKETILIPLSSKPCIRLKRIVSYFNIFSWQKIKTSVTKGIHLLCAIFFFLKKTNSIKRVVKTSWKASSILRAKEVTVIT